jgi:hypothetical protein
MRHRSLLDCEHTGRSLIGSQEERLLMLTPFHKITVLTVNTMHQILLCCGARMAFTQSKHGASRLDAQPPRIPTKSGNSSTKLTPPNSELEASKHEASKKKYHAYQYHRIPVPEKNHKWYLPPKYREIDNTGPQVRAHTTRIHASAECFEVPHPTRGYV